MAIKVLQDYRSKLSKHRLIKAGLYAEDAFEMVLVKSMIAKGVAHWVFPEYAVEYVEDSLANEPAEALSPQALEGASESLPVDAAQGKVIVEHIAKRGRKAKAPNDSD